MSLPKYSYPVYTLVVPSTGKEMKYRPFLVRDEKNLLLSQQSEQVGSMYETLRSVIASCITDKTDVESLAIFDLEYIFTQLRCKSIGEDVELIFTCTECGKKTEHLFPIQAEVKMPEGHDKKIALFDNVGAVMKYPGVEQMKTIADIDFKNPEQVIELIASCIDYVYDEDNIYYAKDQTKKELVQFVENLPRNASDKIKNFFETVPKLSQTITFKCKHCDHENEYKVEGIENFF